MAIVDDIRKEIKDIFATAWKERDGQDVPEAESVRLGNDAVKIQGTVLYADLADSTDLVNTYSKSFSAEIYKSFLISACRIIKHNGGVITAFDGDRVMAVFIGKSKNTSAVKSALNINHAVKMVNEQIKSQYPILTYEVKHSVGVDASDLFVAKTGVRGSNDLVWVGRAANYAAKLCSLRDGNYTSWITKDIYENMHDSVKIGGAQKNMWEARTWTKYNYGVYRSNWQWAVAGS